MAVLKSASAEVNVTNGERLAEAADELGVSFGCRKGICGACVVEVLEGMENLAAKNDAEAEFSMRDNDRMMCQCSIVGGEATIKP